MSKVNIHKIDLVVNATVVKHKANKITKLAVLINIYFMSLLLVLIYQWQPSNLLMSSMPQKSLNFFEISSKNST